jgi:hypothetical protein
LDSCKIWVKIHVCMGCVCQRPKSKPLCLSQTPRTVHTKKGSKSGSAQRNSSLIAKLFLSLQSRPDADLEEFFCYENQTNLSNQGSMRSGNMVDILYCLSAPHSRSDEAKAATVVILDMTAVVHMIRPTTGNTFQEYVSMHHTG